MWITSSLKSAAPKESLAFPKKLRKKLQVNIQWNVLISGNAKKKKQEGFPGKSYIVNLTE